jgi:acetylglutamate kinase
VRTPSGFTFSGVAAGIKSIRKDVALIVSDRPCAAAACFTQSRTKGAHILDAEARLPSSGIRAVLVNSGNANALTGAVGVADVQTIRASLAENLSIGPDQILTASTGIIGHRLPVTKIQAALPRLVSRLAPEPEEAAMAILTTDTRTKMASRVIEIEGCEVTISGICKGAGMIHPSLATMIAVITTDCSITPPRLRLAIRQAVEQSFHCLTVDGDMSPNDTVFALANGRAGHPQIECEGEPFARFASGLRELCQELARAIAADGEGATKMLTVRVSGAPSDEMARDLARQVAGSALVKAAMFGADANWGRILTAIGARAGTRDYPIDPTAGLVKIQGCTVYDGVHFSAPMAVFDLSALRERMREPEVLVEVAFRAGNGEGVAWGCDLSYDYVKVNAEYTSLLVTAEDGSVTKDHRLSNYSPAFKASLLVEALSYISRFAHTRCVVKYGGAERTKESLQKSFCEDVNLLRSLGLVPIVVHPRADEVVALMNRDGGHAVGVSGRDGAVIRAKRARTVEGSGELPEGEIVRVNRDFLEILLHQEYVPVISPVGVGDQGEGYRLNADAVAAEVASAVGAQKLVFFVDVPGILENGELLSELTVAELDRCIEDGRIAGSMRDKALSIRRALQGGVERVHVIDGRVPHSLIAELFTDHGVGTLIIK